jgi:hypothetical protein
MRIAASEAGMRNVYEVRASQMISAEDTTQREIVRRAMLAEADQSQLRATKQPDALCRLTPELSRPAAGWRTRASVAQARGRRHDAGSA